MEFFKSYFWDSIFIKSGYGNTNFDLSNSFITTDDIQDIFLVKEFLRI